LSTRLEKWAFRVGLLGLIALVGWFVWEETHDRPAGRVAALTTTVTTAAGATTSSGTSGTDGSSSTTTGSTAPAPPTAITDPGFVVTSPEDGAIVGAPDLEFVGNGPAGEVVHRGSDTATVGEDSIWRMTLTLEPGPNTVMFTVLNSDGTPLYTTVGVTYVPPETTDTTTEG
jgi:hypothetical protein